MYDIINMLNQFYIMNRSIFVLFLGYTNFMNLIKMQIPLNWYGFILRSILIGLATIGVCVFCASASVGAFFNL